MDRQMILVIGAFIVFSGLLVTGMHAAEAASRPAGKIIGMYVHQHWPYNHPYAARTWTLDDWRGYADGLSKLGYNTIMIWPMIETMPDPLTPSDEQSLRKIEAVIRMLHDEFKMRVWIALCPNVAADNREAAKATFEKRHFFYCDTRINPGSPVELKRFMEWREKLMRPLAAVDGVAVIDSDPGGYPGSTNAEFVNLLVEHRKMLDRLRPGIELNYWMHVGWEGYCRFYKTGQFSWGTADENADVLRRLKEIDSEPWGIANGLQYAEKLGLASRVISFNYGRIEFEPSFPLTNFAGETAYEGGKSTTARGVMGNAQTHCVQLPNTFAFARGATGQPLTDEDYIRFADDLLTGCGPIIVDAWRALAGSDAAKMDRLAGELQELAGKDLKPGRLKGLLFGDGRRFLNDLVLQLRLRAAWETFRTAVEHQQDPKQPFERFVTAATDWQKQHGYENAWQWPGMDETLRKLNSPEINAVLGTQFSIESGPDPTSALSPFEQLQRRFRDTETYVTRLLEAMKTASKAMR